MSEFVGVVVNDGVMAITLDRPDKRNALSTAMIGSLADALARAELDADVRVVALRGKGKDFCAGADLSELLASVDNPVEQNERDALRLGEVFLAIRRLPKLVVAVVTGRALAGGAGLATACDLVLAAESSRFGYPEVERGFVPAMVMTMLRRSVGEKRALDLVVSGRIISAAEALELGMVSRLVPDHLLEGTAAELLSTLAARPPTATALTKHLFMDLDQKAFGDGILLGARVNALSRQSGEFRTAVSAFLKR